MSILVMIILILLTNLLMRILIFSLAYLTNLAVRIFIFLFIKLFGQEDYYSEKIVLRTGKLCNLFCLLRDIESQVLIIQAAFLIKKLHCVIGSDLLTDFLSS